MTQPEIRGQRSEVRKISRPSACLEVKIWSEIEVMRRQLYSLYRRDPDLESEVGQLISRRKGRA
jgi:hypothetical protein